MIEVDYDTTKTKALDIAISKATLKLFISMEWHHSQKDIIYQFDTYQFLENPTNFIRKINDEWVKSKLIDKMPMDFEN